MPITRSAASSNRTKDNKRIFTDVILPIKSRFVELIVSGDKNYEYRNYKLRDSVKRLWLYEVAPSRRIRYILYTGRPKQAGEVNDASGVGNNDFDKGLKSSRYGYPIHRILRLENPISAKDMKVTFGISIPQSYCFVVSPLFAFVQPESLAPLNLKMSTTESTKRSAPSDETEQCLFGVGQHGKPPSEAELLKQPGGNEVVQQRSLVKAMPALAVLEESVTH